ncbi:VOC family protein [Amycolatopsis sp.]|uniref:VOC family protein n=1 Tax=Amycolatopsis sp. TaxID=37632 RepID=UPI002B846DAC|nr:VOC family protein [Amycolatopsis sp.]HVV08942.1 VOC family protein [Amycolatopsis sp.]
MSSPFVFMDVRTTDVGASRRFYTELFGWQVADLPVPMFTGETGPWGALTQLAEDDARQPQWIPYAPVADLDAAVAKAVGLGATVTRERVDLPQGSVTVIEDPVHATLALWEAHD